MKNLFYLLLAACLFSACGEVTEEITINKDGSGTYEVSSDIIPMIRGMASGFAKFAPKDEKLDSVALAKKIEEMVWKDFPDEVDSTLNMDPEILKEYQNDPQKLALINQTTMYMRGGRAQGYMKTGLKFGFKNSSQLEEFTQMLEENSSKDPQTKMLSDTETTLKLTKNSFYRSSKQAVTEANDSTMAVVSQMMKDMRIITIINFPKKIKAVDVTTYEILHQTDNSITLSYNPLVGLKKGMAEIKIDY